MQKLRISVKVYPAASSPKAFTRQLSRICAARAEEIVLLTTKLSHRDQQQRDAEKFYHLLGDFGDYLGRGSMEKEKKKTVESSATSKLCRNR